jgi:pimeloyl-ACP methyl ester carboxylesterase
MPPVVERRDQIAPACVAAPADAPAFSASDVRLVEYSNDRGEKLRAIIDVWGETRGAPAIVIPPAWGKTKETLLPLAETLVATFREAGVPVTVLRYDGIRRRGESHNDPECRIPGYENLHYTFSQGAEDVRTTLDFLERSPEYQPRTVILVTFSVASIEARHAIAQETRGRIGGWISVVGSSDPQSLMRVISGGVDYLGGADRGVRFGFQDVQGMLLDIDRAAADAIDRGIAFLDDARRDLARIQVPITWLHGRYDAWMQIERIRHVLSFGDSGNRRLLEVPTGHQLKSSREALEAFQLISAEAARMALGREVAAGFPDLQILKQRRRLEMRRFGRPDVDLRDFWRDYLVGRDGQLGIELVTCTSSYQDLMDAQLEALALAPGERVLDLGSGAGALPARLANVEAGVASCDIIELDYVSEGLLRTRERLEAAPGHPGHGRVRFLVADLDRTSRGGAIPLASGCADAALASLLLNYLAEPTAFLREVHRVLRPGGGSA